MYRNSRPCARNLFDILKQGLPGSMRYDTRYRYSGFNYSSYFPAGVKWLLISNTVIFLISFMLVDARESIALFSLVPWNVVHRLELWRLVTYMFLHGSITHILFNMLTLWMFGMTLEQDWGTRRFLRFYFFCGVGAGLCDMIAKAITHNMGQGTIGASGAIFGLLLAFGVLYPKQTVLFFFVFPMQARYFVLILGTIEFLIAWQANASGGVSNIAHLGGMLFGYIYLKARFLRVDTGYFRRGYNSWKVRRAKRKFQVYMKKHGSDRDTWVN